MKMLLGLVRPTSGSGVLLGTSIEHPSARRSTGFLPEHFRFHEWLRADEFLDLHGQLYDMSRTDRRERIPYLFDRVGLADSSHKRLSTYSKGMLQRIGLAMALLPRPDIVFLDEPTSGLDPFGRLLVRDVIREARQEGTTVFLNSHLLGEVEATCDRVAFIRQGVVIRAGTIGELTAGRVRVHLRLAPVSAELLADLAEWSSEVRQTGEQHVALHLPDESRLPELVAWLVGQGIQLYAMTPRPPSLEELFVQIMQEGEEADA
jgi:ABC-2 type transport system ATP-binding protein